MNFSFFQKSIKTPFVVMKDSAMGQSQKISILSIDLLRRLSNCSETVEMSEKVQIIDDYTETLSVSGYSKREIKEIIESGLTGFVRKVERLRKAGIPFHRPASMTLQGRIRKKLLEKTNWYKGDKKRKQENEASRFKYHPPAKRRRQCRQEESKNTKEGTKTMAKQQTGPY